MVLRFPIYLVACKALDCSYHPYSRLTQVTIWLGHISIYVCVYDPYHLLMLGMYTTLLVSSICSCGLGSSVGIATDYRLDDPGLNPGGDEIFRPFRPPWGPPSLLYNGYRVFPGGKEQPERDADPSPL